ncbi:rhodanese-like domain-containing protein [Rhodoferax mekongensis]|uniref:Rhodanese-like domain-containing protein n=1 Tax=Rhodoferax mekongensis TaxID=3068341 RepID=A0ABZ0AYA8_9BURK|nr:MULTISPECIES: rhodanese-like domain-containing protein [unclassified Rhodoferax]MDT7514759.1 rhodanese-like domain-containing protein [Rhodoferax sp. TBRC 17199]WNO04480.1 rhodanese-like domain-containing protein [Rhodoferax sp. TBRC 17307]
MIHQIRPTDLEAWYASVQGHGQPLVLDVREPHELALASVVPDGFDVLSIPMGVVPVRLQELPADRPIACLCHHGARSMQVALFLQSRGFEDLANIAGGIDAWSAERDVHVPRY